MFAVGPHGAEGNRATAMGPVGASVRDFSIFLERQVGSRAASEDILRDAFVSSRRDLLQSNERISSWFYRSLRDAVLDQPAHAASSESKLGAFRAELAQKIEPSPAMHEAIARHVGAISATLAAEHAEVLQRIDLEGEKLTEYARRTGTPASTVEALLGAARAELRQQVMQSFGTCSAHGFLNCTCGASLGNYGRGQHGASR